MSTNTVTLPADHIHGVPVDLLQAANNGDTTAMRALVDFLLERGLPAQELESEPMLSDHELALGFLRLAHEYETNARQLQHLDQLLTFFGRPTRQPLPKRHLVIASPHDPAARNAPPPRHLPRNTTPLGRVSQLRE